MKVYAHKNKYLSRPRMRDQLVPSVVNQQRAALRQSLRSPSLQTKLKVGEFGDEYEQEADRIADQVMRMPDAEITSATVQRKYTDGDDEDGEEEILQAKLHSSDVPELESTFHHKLSALTGQGSPLSSQMRAFFEPRIGHDFSGVRIHQGARAAQLARTAHARAFTHEQDVVFAPGEYAPQTQAGKHLLAHELTHVVQQSHGTHQQAPSHYIARLERPEFTEQREAREARRRSAFLIWLAPAMGLVRLLQIQFSISRRSAENTAAIVLRNRARIRQAASATGRCGIPPELLAAVVTMEMMNRRNWRGFEIWWARHIYTGDPSLGLTQLSLSTAAMLEGDIPWIESAGGGRAAHTRARERVEEAYGQVSSERREQLVEQLADPLRNLQTSARLLARLKNRAHRYPSLTADQLYGDQNAVAILGTEYHVGPTTTLAAQASPEDYGRSIGMLTGSSSMRTLMGRT